MVSIQDSIVLVFAGPGALAGCLGRPALQHVLAATEGFRRTIVVESSPANADHRTKIQKVITASGFPRAELLQHSAEELTQPWWSRTSATCQGFVLMRGDLALVTKQNLESLFRAMCQERIIAMAAPGEPEVQPDGSLQHLGIRTSQPESSPAGVWVLGMAICNGCHDLPRSLAEMSTDLLWEKTCKPPAADETSIPMSARILVCHSALHAAAEGLMRQRIISRMQHDGVSFQDPNNTHIDADVSIEPGVHIGVGIQLYGRTVIEQDAVIEGPTYIRDSRIGARCHIKPFCHLEGCSLAESCQLGPYARLRPGADLEDSVFLGNFVEVKNSRMGSHSQASHLTYIGDADVGESVLIAAGCITCNFDGARKHHTSIGQHAFIGSNTAMVAPVTIGHHAIVGAGSTITEDVPPQALGIARSRQTVVNGYAQRVRNK